MKLNDSKLRNIKPSPKAMKLYDGGGLYLEVTPKGGFYWRQKYRFLGKEKKLAHGVYPIISLAQARKLRDEAKVLLAQNIDPAEAKKAGEREKRIDAVNTFEALAREWFEIHSQKVKATTARDIIVRLEKDVFPIIGKRPIKELSPPEMLEMLKKTEERGAYEMARRAKQYCSKVFRYGIQTGRADRDHTSDLEGVLLTRKVVHHAALDPKELPEFLKSLQRNDARLYPQTRMAMELMMLTFVRTSELIAARWNEFDFEQSQWIIPAERMKMGKKQLHLI